MGQATHAPPCPAGDDRAQRLPAEMLSLDWAPHRAGADPEVLLLDILHTLIHTFVPEHLMQRWGEGSQGLARPRVGPPGRAEGQSER